MTSTEESVHDDKNDYDTECTEEKAALYSEMTNKVGFTRPTSTIIVGDLLDNGRQLVQLQNNDNTESIETVIDITKSVPEEEKHLVKEAGQGGAVLGFLVGGPIGSALLGFGSAYAIRKPKDSTIGKASRSLADLTLSVKEKAKGVEKEHHFVERSK